MTRGRRTGNEIRKEPKKQVTPKVMKVKKAALSSRRALQHSPKNVVVVIEAPNSPPFPKYIAD